MNNIRQQFMLLAALALTSGGIAAQDQTISSGHLQSAFSSWGSPSLQGDWKIVKSDGKTVIELGDNFKAKEGPDVKIFLSPRGSAEITGQNAPTDSVFITQISVFEGKSVIEIPTDINLADYQSLVFHCEAYSKLWGVAPLQ